MFNNNTNNTNPEYFLNSNVNPKQSIYNQQSYDQHQVYGINDGQYIQPVNQLENQFTNNQQNVYTPLAYDKNQPRYIQQPGCMYGQNYNNVYQNQHEGYNYPPINEVTPQIREQPVYNQPETFPKVNQQIPEHLIYNQCEEQPVYNPNYTNVYQNQTEGYNKLTNKGYNIPQQSPYGADYSISTSYEEPIVQKGYQNYNISINRGRNRTNTFSQSGTIYRNNDIKSNIELNRSNSENLPNTSVNTSAYSKLQTAILNGNFSQVDTLISQGCLIDVKDKEGCTLLHLLAKESVQNPTIVKWDDIAEKINIQYNIPVNEKDNNGNTPLHYCIGNVPPDFTLWLISNGATDIENNNKEKPSSLVLDYIDEKADNNTLLSSAAGVIYLCTNTNLLNYKQPHHNFHCPDRFSLRSAYTMALVSKLVYLGRGNKNVATNNIIHAFKKRWGFSTANIIDIHYARGIVLTTSVQITETNEMKECYIISFRGTNTVKEILVDLTAIKSNGRHIGVLKHLNTIVDPILNELTNKSALIYVTGHSLGGAMATLFVDKLRKNGFNPNNLYLYTFGQPRVGTKKFQKKFDNTYHNAYTIQRYLDPVPFLPSNNGKIIGGYVHCGSLKYIDQYGQLYNDMHYKFEDIKRTSYTNKKDTLEDIKKTWTDGLRKLDHSTLEINKQSSTHSSDIIHENSAIHTILKDVTMTNINPLECKQYHSVDNYLLDIAILEAKRGQKFDADESPHEAITSQIYCVHIPSEFNDPSIKNQIIEREKKIVFNNWIKFYTIQLPKYSYTLQVGLNYLVEWIKYERLILQHTAFLEYKILQQFPNLPAYILYPPNTYRRKNISPIIETAFYTCLSKIILVAKTNISNAIGYLCYLYWCLPSTALIQKKKKNNTYTLKKYPSSNYYRDEIFLCLTHLQNNSTTHSDIIDFLLLLKPQIINLNEGKEISTLSEILVDYNIQFKNIINSSKLLLLKIGIYILREFGHKFKKMGIKVAKFIAGASVIGIAVGATCCTVATTGILACSLGTAGPLAVATGLTIGSVVGVGTTATIVTGGAIYGISKIPEYFSSLISTFEQLVISFTNLGIGNVKSQARRDIITTANDYPIRFKVFLHFINALYVKILLCKETNLGEQYVYSINNEVVNFFTKIITLLQNATEYFNIESIHINQYSKLLTDFCPVLEENIDEITDIILDISSLHNITNYTEGIYFYRMYLDKKTTFIRLNKDLDEKLRKIGENIQNYNNELLNNQPKNYFSKNPSYL